MRNEKGFVEAVIIVITAGIVFGLLFAACFVRFRASNEVVSGIVYNTTNDSLISGKTRFSVRASEDTYVSEENRSSYCLPSNSRYKELVNKAAQDKRIKVVVEARKYIAIQLPWTCHPNVKVTEVK